MSPVHDAAIERELLLVVGDVAGSVGDQRPEHGGFPGAVAPDESDLFPAADARGEVADDLEVVI
jgi:hypothetical protein